MKLRLCGKSPLGGRSSRMSGIGTKRTWASAPHMSVFANKADIPFCTAYVRLWPEADIGFHERRVLLPTQTENQTGGDASVDWGGMIKIKYR
jgi:hypothetical protein